MPCHRSGTSEIPKPGAIPPHPIIHCHFTVAIAIWSRLWCVLKRCPSTRSGRVAAGPLSIAQSFPSTPSHKWGLGGRAMHPRGSSDVGNCKPVISSFSRWSRRFPRQALRFAFLTHSVSEQYQYTGSRQAIFECSKLPNRVFSWSTSIRMRRIKMSRRCRQTCNKRVSVSNHSSC